MSPSTPSLATLAIHADDKVSQVPVPAVAPPIHVSTIFHYPRDPTSLITAAEHHASSSSSTTSPPTSTPTVPSDFPYIYSRYTAPSTNRLEHILTTILHGPSVTYSSGLSAFHALLIRVNPPRLIIGNGYHGSRSVADIFTRLTGMQILPLSTPPRTGDLVHLETPLNPDGTATDIKSYADAAHAAGAVVSVDSTFAPPPLQDPFVQGADYVLHSATKYLGGHSDLLGGVLAVRGEGEAAVLRGERAVLGNVMGGLEGWLGLRSVKTLELRVGRQSESATRLVGWLSGLVERDEEVGSVVVEVRHASLQKEEWVKAQMPGGYGPVFSVSMRNREQAKTFPGRLRYFHHATSLGGVESLVEWRAMSDEHVSETVVRVSVGCEGWEDLRDDVERAIREVARMGL